MWRIDRPGRPVGQLVDQLADLQERGIGFRSLKEAIDTPSSGERLDRHTEWSAFSRTPWPASYFRRSRPGTTPVINRQRASVKPTTVSPVGAMKIGRFLQGSGAGHRCSFPWNQLQSCVAGGVPGRCVMLRVPRPGAPFAAVIIEVPDGSCRHLGDSLGRAHAARKAVL